MGYSNTDLGEYAESLYKAKNFEEAFNSLEEHVLKLGFEGVLYTYIPRILLESNFSSQPVYEVSSDYAPAYLQHYTEARFDKNDPLIQIVSSGYNKEIDWWEGINKEYMDRNKASKEVIATSLDYGISNGITLPLLSGEKGISGASFISSETRVYKTLKKENLDNLMLCTKMFHSLVISDACYSRHFLMPLLESLSLTERKFLQGLAQGKSPTKISVELNRSEKYLEQVMLKLKYKLSDTNSDNAKIINRNQLLYYAGLLGLIDQI